MKSKTVESIFIIVIVAAVLLLIPFFVPYEEDNSRTELSGGEYAIEGEEEPETFTRIIERVSSFYGVKRGRKNDIDKDKSVVPGSTEHTGILATAKSNKGKLSADKSLKQPAQKNSSNYAQGNTDGVRYFVGPDNQGTGGKEAFRNNKQTDKVEYRGKVYNIEPDSYGNEYIITDKGPVALANVLKQGGYIINDAGQAGAERQNNSFWNRKNRQGDNNAGQFKRTIGRDFAKSGNNQISSFRNGKMKSFSNGNENTEIAERNFSGNGGGKYFGNYDFNSVKDYENLAKTLQSNTSGDTSAGTKNKETEKKVYVLQNTVPTVGEKPVGISFVEDKNQNNIVIGNNDWGGSDWDGAISGEASGDVLAVKLSADYEQAQGIMIQNDNARSMMTYELIKDKVYAADTGKGMVANPWILPNNIRRGPGNSFYDANKAALSNSNFTKLDWDESDKYYSESKQNIMETSGGKPIRVAIIDGQKDIFTMTTMPQDTFYYKLTAGLLNGNAVNASDNGAVDLNSLDKNNVLVVVPEKSLADNLKKDGYKVALFDSYIVTPSRLKNFYGRTVSAVKGIAKAREEDPQIRKDDLMRSLSNIK